MLRSWLVSKTGSPALAQGQPVRFHGMEIHLGQDGASFEASQKGFTEELLRAHGHKGSKSWSMGPRDQLLLKRGGRDRPRDVNLKGASVSFRGSCLVVGQTSSTW